MQTFTTKASAITYAKRMGWTGADANRAFEGLKAPVDEITLLYAMVRFAGPELAHRQNLQAAQKGQVTSRVKQIHTIETQHAADIQKFKDEVQNERSQWLHLIRILYGIGSKFGWKDPMIEHILNTYDAA